MASPIFSDLTPKNIAELGLPLEQSAARPVSQLAKSLMDEPKKLLTLAEVARLVNRGEKYIQRMADAGVLNPTVQNGREMFWPEEAALLVNRPDDQPNLGEVFRSIVHARGAITPDYVPPQAKAVLRDMSELTGPTGGYLVAHGLLGTYMDRIYSFEPLSRLNWAMTSLKEYDISTALEVSRAPGARFGGAYIRYGPSEGTDLSVGPAFQPQVSNIHFVHTRQVAYGPIITDDLLKDSYNDLFSQMLDRDQIQGMALQLIDILVGNPPFQTSSLISGKATITVAPEGSQTAGTIVYQNIENMVSRLADGCYDNAIFMCNQDTLLQIMKLASTDSWTSTVWMPRGADRNPYPQLMGLPLVTVASCPPVGSPGDLILLDPKQITASLMFPPMADGKLSSPLMLSVRSTDEANEAIRMGLTRRQSEHRYWELDKIACFASLRVSIRPLWDQPAMATNTSQVAPNNTVSPFVIIGQR
jgi:hypothetical protein